MNTLTLQVLILLAGVHADIKILNTPAGKVGSEPCARICSGVDQEYTQWVLTANHPTKVHKYINISDCNFVYPPVITAVSGGSADNFRLCPSFTIPAVNNDGFKLYSVVDSSHDRMRVDQCNVYWTASGFVC